MHRMSRTGLAIAATVAMVAGLAACTTPTDTPEEGSLSGTLTIAHWDFLAPAYGEEMQAIIKSYEEYNPEATIETVGIVRADYETKLKIQFSSGGGPDVFTMADTFFPELAAANLLSPLDDVLSEDVVATLNNTNNAVIRDDQRLAVTWQVAPYAFLWNKDILEAAGVEPPTTPEELLAAAIEIKEKTGITGFAVRHRLAEETPWWIDFNNWPVGFGGGWSKDGQLTIDSPENIEAVTWFKKMYDSGAFAVGDDASTFRTKFSEGQLAMMIDATGAPPAMISETVPSTSMMASPLPFPELATSQVGIYMGINSGTKNKPLAEDFIKWFLTPDVQQQISQVIGNTSTVATDTAVPDGFFEENPWAEAYRANGAYTQSAVIRDFENVTPQIRNVVLGWIEKVLLEDLDPKEALESAANALK